MSDGESNLFDDDDDVFGEAPPLDEEEEPAPPAAEPPADDEEDQDEEDIAPKKIRMATKPPPPTGPMESARGYKRSRRGRLDEERPMKRRRGEGKKRRGEAPETKPATEFEQAMERVKAQRRKKQVTQEEAAERVQSILQKMRDMAEQDDSRLAAGKPAIGKLSIIDNVASEIAKPVWTQWYLQEGLVPVVEKWLAPLPDGGLPNLTLRSKVLVLLARLHISPDYLAGAVLGERLLEIWKHPDETEENRQTIRKICAQVVKPILQPRSYHGGHAHFDHGVATASAAPAAAPSNVVPRNDFRAAIPRVQARTFRVAPRSNLPESTRMDVDGDRLNRLVDQRMRQPKRKVAGRSAHTAY